MHIKGVTTDTREAAESVAIQALSYLASDTEQLERFLTLTGLDHAAIRTAAAQPGFLAGVLDHVLSDESLTVAFAAYANLPPVEVDRARAALSGPRWQRDDA
jgi:hypothetical protein